MAAVGTAAFVVGLGVALAVLAMAAQTRAAQQDLAAVDIDARAIADQVLNGHLDAARTTLGRLQQDARAAQRRTRGFLWAVGEHLPLVGRTPQAIGTLADSAVSLAEDVLPQMLRVGDNLALDAATSKRGDSIDASQPAAQIDLHRLHVASDALVTATRAARQAVGRVDSLRTAAIFSPVRRRVIAARVRLDRLVDRLEAAAQLSQVTAGLLGGQGRRSYPIALQNSAEARGTGGLAGAFVVLTADRGKLRIVGTGVDDELDAARAPLTMLGAPYRALYGPDAALWANANLSPYFPTAARLWLADWRQVFRTRIDGVIATDPSALAGLLSALGPIRLHPHGEVVNAANVVSLTERDLYVRFAHDNSGRKAFLLSLLRQVTQRALQAAPGEAPRLLAAAGAAANNGRFLAYSTRPDEEAAFERLGWAGALPALTQPSLRLSVDNAGGNKLDYYLRRQLRYELGRCAGRMRPTTVTAKPTNAVPEGPLPHYAASRSDLASRGNAPAESNRLLVYLHLTAGAGLQSAELDGHRTPVHVGVEQGHPVVALAVDLRPGESRQPGAAPARAEARRRTHRAGAATGAATADRHRRPWMLTNQPYQRASVWTLQTKTTRGAAMQPPTRNSVRRLLGSTAVACAIAAGIATPAAATPPTYPPAGPTSTTVLGTTITRTPTAPSSSQLPFTGNPIAAYTLSGAALVLAGGLLSLSVRRRRTRRVTTS